MQNSVVRVDKLDKMDRLKGALSLRIAAKAGDPLYTKLIKAKKLYMAIKSKLMAKYSMKGTAAAKKVAMTKK